MSQLERRWVLLPLNPSYDFFDEKIERDAATGKLDARADQTIDDFRKGRAREL